MKEPRIGSFLPPGPVSPPILGVDGYDELMVNPVFSISYRNNNRIHIPTPFLTERTDGAESKCIQEANNR